MEGFVAVAAAATNASPSFTGTTAARSVAENATSGDVGAALTASDADGDTLAYSVAATADTDAAAHLAAFNRDFSLDMATGQISVKSGATIDFEARSSYVVTISVTDSKDTSGVAETGTPTIDDTVEVTITVTDVDESEAVTLNYSDPWAGVTVIAGMTGDTPTGLTWQWELSEDGSTGWAVGTGTVVDGNHSTSSYLPVDGDVGKYLRATASYSDVGGTGKSASVTSTAMVVAEPECASYSDIDNSAIGGDALVSSGWSDGRIMWVGLIKNDSDDPSLSNPVRAFELCSGQRSTAVGERHADFGNGNNARVWGMWTDGPTMWVSQFARIGGVLVDPTKLYAFTMHPTRGWVRDSTSDYATGVRTVKSFWSDGSVIWVGSAQSPRSSSSPIYYAFDWANRPAGGSLRRLASSDIPRSAISGGRHDLFLGIASDGDYLYLTEFSHPVLLEAVTIPISGHPASTVPAKNITLHSNVQRMEGLWSDGERIWVMSYDDDNPADDPDTKVFVYTIPNGGPSFADSDGDSTADPVSLSVDENAAAGASVGTVAAAEIDLGFETRSDPEGDTVVYSVGGADAAAFNADFALDTATGEITVKTGGTVDHEDKSSYDVAINATDGKDASGSAESTATVDDTVVLTVTVKDVDEPGTVTIEGTAQVRAALTASLSDPDGSVTGLTWQWSRSDDADGTGSVAVVATTALYTPVADDLGKYLTAEASYTDGFGSGKTAEATTAAAVAVGFLVSNLEQASAGASPLNSANAALGQSFRTGNSAATLTGVRLLARLNDNASVSLRANSSGQPASSGTALAQPGGLTSTAPSLSQEYVFTASGNGIALTANTTYWVVITGNGGRPFRTMSDDQTNVPGWSMGNAYSTYNGSAWSSDSDSHSMKMAIEGTLSTAADQPGTVTIDGTARVGESLAASLSDPDGAVSASVTWQWSRSDDADGTGSVAVVATTALYTPVVADLGKYLTATAGYTDGFGSGRSAAATTAAVLAAAVTNASPSFTGTSAARSVAENATSGNVGAVLTASDGDGDTLAYSVAATADADAGDHLSAFNRDFALDAATGQITVKSAAAIDYETRSAYKVLYQVSDGKDSSGNADTAVDDMLTLTVTVTNADEAGTVTISGIAWVGVALKASVSDPDGAVSESVTWRWSRSDDADGTGSVAVVATTALYTPVADDVGKYLTAKASYTDGLGSGKSAEATSAAVSLLLVSNLAQLSTATSVQPISSSTLRRAQSFMTGTNRGDAHGGAGRRQVQHRHGAVDLLGQLRRAGLQCGHPCQSQRSHRDSPVLGDQRQDVHRVGQRCVIDGEHHLLGGAGGCRRNQSGDK